MSLQEASIVFLLISVFAGMAASIFIKNGNEYDDHDNP